MILYLISGKYSTRVTTDPSRLNSGDRVIKSKNYDMPKPFTSLEEARTTLTDADIVIAINKSIHYNAEIAARRDLARGGTQ